MQEYITVTAIVLKQTPVGEYDRRLCLLTKEKGKISAFARGARKPSGKLAAATNPLSFGEFKLYPGKDSYSVVEARGVEPLSENTSARLSPGAAGCLNSFFRAPAGGLREKVAS